MLVEVRIERYAVSQIHANNSVMKYGTDERCCQISFQMGCDSECGEHLNRFARVNVFYHRRAIVCSLHKENPGIIRKSHNPTGYCHVHAHIRTQTHD